MKKYLVNNLAGDYWIGSMLLCLPAVVFLFSAGLLFLMPIQVAAIPFQLILAAQFFFGIYFFTAIFVLKRRLISLRKEFIERQEAVLETQKEMEKVKRLSDIGMLAATVVHELRNPLAAINMAAVNIKQKAMNPLLDKHLENIEKKYLKAARL